MLVSWVKKINLDWRKSGLIVGTSQMGLGLALDLIFIKFDRLGIVI